MQNYIVRIYRHADRDDQGVVGTVEAVVGGRLYNFKTRDELWAILQNPAKCTPGHLRKAKSEIKDG